jgi:hypothetical protein
MLLLSCNVCTGKVFLKLAYMHTAVRIISFILAIFSSVFVHAKSAILIVIFIVPECVAVVELCMETSSLKETQQLQKSM